MLNALICTPNYYYMNNIGKPTKITEVLNPNWVPNQNLGYKHGLALKKPSRCIDLSNQSKG